MSAPGKQLEELVAFIESKVLPPGLSVNSNVRAYGRDGNQVAEFDVVVSGKVGTADFKWLIECRNRPHDGKAPGAWVEQLAGRRGRFKFDRVTAVSTTGFSPSALEAAREAGIDLREVAAISPDAFGDWLALEFLTRITTVCELRATRVNFSKEDFERVGSALTDSARVCPADAPVLLAIKTGERFRLQDAFRAAVEQQGGLFDRMIDGGEEQIVMDVAYTKDDDHFVYEVGHEKIRIQEIRFEGVLRVRKEVVPLTWTAEYKRENSDIIAQVASFAPMTIDGRKLKLEFRRIPEVQQVFVVLRTATEES